MSTNNHYGFINIKAEIKDEIYESVLINLVANKNSNMENTVKHNEFLLSEGGPNVDRGGERKMITFYFKTKADLDNFENEVIIMFDGEDICLTKGVYI